MKAVVQRVDNASVEIEGDVISRIDKGLVVLLGIGKGDTEEDAACLIEKIKNLRIFEDDAGRFDQSLLDVGGELLIVSQFTLYADCSKGRRPGFDLAASPDDARRLYNHFVDLSKMSGIKVATGRFQAHMLVRIANQGPVTIILDCPIRGV
ncbi:D-tyrosyl-tRNA(Tyr) deacylase [bacterium]|nr:D-tyrosyl-tRNA(Tyr) deacylase [bacterium]